MPAPRPVLLARHGETDWNAALRWQGQTDVPLNARGVAQARALGERLRGERVAAIAASDLARARHTAEIVAGVLGLAVAALDPELRERHFGRWEGLTRAECERSWPDAWASYRADPEFPPPGGESRVALLGRILPALARIVDVHPSPALVVTHGGVIAAVLDAVPAAARPAAPASRGLGRVPNGAVLRASLVDGRVVGAAWLEPATP